MVRTGTHQNIYYRHLSLNTPSVVVPPIHHTRRRQEEDSYNKCHRVRIGKKKKNQDDDEALSIDQDDIEANMIMVEIQMRKIHGEAPLPQVRIKRISQVAIDRMCLM